MIIDLRHVKTPEEAKAAMKAPMKQLKRLRTIFEKAAEPEQTAQQAGGGAMVGKRRRG